ncbi:MAG: hypothetical protein MUF23_01620 [Pirellula sp.]|jgi:hypothetical protein|nr:hypothetical protein [Pirellula sp.]
MNFETQVVLQRIVVPSLLGLAGGFVLSRCERRALATADGSGDSPLRLAATASILGALFVGAGLIASDLWQRGLITNPATWRRWDAREPWMWMVWMVPSLMFVLGLLKGLGRTPGRFATWCLPIVVIGAAGILYVALPQGSGYEDKLKDAVRWLALGTVAATVNAVCLNTIAAQPGGRWAPCVLLAQLGCIAGIVLQSYASLGEFVLSAIGILIGLSIVSLAIPSPSTHDYGWQLAPAVLAMSVLAVACLAVSTFYVSTPPATWLVLSILFLPALVGCVNCILQKQPWGWRVAAAIVLCGALLAVVIVSAINNKPEW